MKKFLSIILITLFVSTVVGQATASAFSEKILNVAHRGASGHAPEHTILSYELGEKMKGDYIEIDLQMTKDGVLIAMHDETLDRTTDGSGHVKDHTIDEIKQLDAGSWFNERNPEKASEDFVGLTVPTLEEIFIEFGKSTKYYIETKSPEVYPGMEEELLRLLNKYGLTGKHDRVLLQSFSQESLQIIHELDPSWPLVQLIRAADSDNITDEQLEEISTYAIGVGPNHTRISEEDVARVLQYDLDIHPYTVNNPEVMHELLDWGVTGLFTDYPDVLWNVLKERQTGR
ncbi:MULTISPECIES: glycerophosphodiester phosphodiesterase [Alteribacter]|uniref:Glycerophosphodiester phosphodiesterase n=1 Tax=Alteribacter keqinensis TaxID=2483800 RepID=A0A3M7TPW1_9BACI|nr:MULTISPECIES: glycerophosphodiester phosphodiesterase [Alteribacter]MBM7096937.1 glycerophosphodiester phosphodiesterase [Alteribacter salitolerans]RNA67485.1 glycerophosphodiester phosphodiesterase [Alteribacter keqinensis]